jgi:hypothetical protein
LATPPLVPLTEVSKFDLTLMIRHAFAIPVKRPVSLCRKIKIKTNNQHDGSKSGLTLILWSPPLNTMLSVSKVMSGPAAAISNDQFEKPGKKKKEMNTCGLSESDISSHGHCCAGSRLEWDKTGNNTFIKSPSLPQS